MKLKTDAELHNERQRNADFGFSSFWCKTFFLVQMPFYKQLWPFLKIISVIPEPMKLPATAENYSARNLKKMVHDYHEQLNQPAGAALYDFHLHIGHSLPVYTNMI